MKDIQDFTTENGIADLILAEIPYRETAYIVFRHMAQPREFLKECRDFCRAVGAEYVYATGSPELESYPLHTKMYRMEVSRMKLPPTDATAEKAAPSDLERWRSIYNERMAKTPNAAHLTTSQVERMLSNCFFVYRGTCLLGIAEGKDNTIDTVISVVPGGGQDVLCAVSKMLTGETVTLTVASQNCPAMRLYQRLGFEITQTISNWYNIS